MQNHSNTPQSVRSFNEATPGTDDLLTWIVAQIHKQGPVLRLPSVRPTFVLSGLPALHVMDDTSLVERTPEVLPAQGSHVFSEDTVAVISATNGDEHQRRRASWLAPGGMDREGIAKALPVIAAIIDATFKRWEKHEIFSLDLEVRRLAWRILNKLVLGCDGDDQILADFETLIGINPTGDARVAKQRVLDWLGRTASAFEADPMAHGDTIGAQLAASGHLSNAELVNELKHALVAGLHLWLPVAEVFRQCAAMPALANTLQQEVTALANNFSPAGMAKTPQLMRRVKDALRVTSPLPLVFARARVTFTVEGVQIPANATLIGALHATNQTALMQGVVGDDGVIPDVSFGVGRHACPAADMMTVTAWLCAAKLLAFYELKSLDTTDLPVQQRTGYYSQRGSLVRFSRRTHPAIAARINESSGVASVSVESTVAVNISAVGADRNTRIAIVGGGITGLTLAHELRKCGYQHITVFERAPSIGGKADTVTIDGRPYNLGAHLCHGNLGVATLASEVGVSLERAPTYELWDIDQNQAIPRSYEHYAQVEKLRRLLAAHPDLEHASGFAATESWTYSSIASWLDANGLSELREVGPFFTGAGYGFVNDDVPAAFFLKFAQHMSEDGWTPTGGYKHLLEQVSHGLNVRCDTEVVQIKRGGADKNAPPADTIQIATRRVSLASQTHASADPAAPDALTHEEFDRLILACPLEHSGQFLDLSTEEQALFSRIRTYDYYTVLATLDIAQPHTPGLYIVPKNTADADKKGHTTAFERAFEESQVYHFFCYGEPGQSEAEILENVRIDARKLGGEITQVHVLQKWAYAPHVSPHDMALGFHRRLDRLQGRQGTYYAGSLLAFELTDHNVLQARSLVERFFAGPVALADTAMALPDNDNPVAVNNDPHSRLPELGTQSILDILRERYEQTPHQALSTFLDTKGKVVRTLTYKVLVERAMACAVSLRDKGVKPGDRVALVYPPDTDEFLVGFFGCLIAEAIAVPVACPDPRKLDIEIPRFAHLMNDCECRVALTTRVYYAIALAGRAWSQITNLTADTKVKWPKLIWIRTDGLSPLAPTARQPMTTPSANTVAYLQYTSGSTSDPKGVMINHGNVLHNVEAIRVQTEVSGSSVLVGWVPLFHDMGLVGGPLTALYCGAHMVFFSPMSFLQNPQLWIKAMHQYRATHTESPNFGYEFLLRNLDDAALMGIDLSCLRYTLFGGEVMRPRTFERMAERLHSTGFRAETMTNIFGAAEGTLFLAGGGLQTTAMLSVATHTLESKRRAVPQSPDLRSTTTLIGCGIPAANCDFRIVDPGNFRLLPEREVGEIWLSSPSVSQGYWGRSTEQNDAIFRARVANDPAPLRTYLRTGDLGFIERDVLYICGRLKEMMIFSGRNIHPMDIELCAMTAHSSIRQGCVVAFSVEEQEQEKLILVAELKSSADAIAAAEAAAAIARVLSDQHSLACKAVLLVRSGTLPKTSSGKLQRYRAREEFLKQQLAVMYAQYSDQEAVSNLPSETVATPDLLGDELFSGDVASTKHWLQRLIAMVLRVTPEEVSTSTSFSMFGIDSPQALTMTSRISTYIGYKLAPAMLYEHPTIDTLALYLCSQAGKQNRVLVQLQKGDATRHPNVFCVHPVGGSAMAYLGLVATLPSHIPVYAFGNDDSEVPADDLVVMAQHYVALMQSIQAKGPYYLLGYSFGGTVVYEMARQILSAGGDVGGVFMIDAPAPLYREDAPTANIAESETYANFLETAIFNRLVPDQLDDEEREKFRVRIDKNQAALSRYRINTKAGVRPRVKIFRATEEAPYLRDSSRHPAFDRPDFGWDEASPGSVMKVTLVPGDHFSVMHEPIVLAAQLVSALLEAQGQPAIVTPHKKRVAELVDA